MHRIFTRLWLFWKSLIIAILTYVLYSVKLSVILTSFVLYVSLFCRLLEVQESHIHVYLQVASAHVHTLLMEASKVTTLNKKVCPNNKLVD